MNCRQILTAFIALMLAACTSPQDDSSQATPSPPQTVRFESDQPGTAFSLQFPADWHHQVSQLGVAISDDANALTSLERPSGAVTANILLISQRDAALMEATDAVEFMEKFALPSSSAGASSPYSETEPITIGGRQGARSFLSADDGDSLLLTLDLQGSFALATFAMPAGQLDRHRAALREIAASIKLLTVEPEAEIASESAPQIAVESAPESRSYRICASQCIWIEIDK